MLALIQVCTSYSLNKTKLQLFFGSQKIFLPSITERESEIEVLQQVFWVMLVCVSYCPEHFNQNILAFVTLSERLNIRIMKLSVFSH